MSFRVRSPALPRGVVLGLFAALAVFYLGVGVAARRAGEPVSLFTRDVFSLAAIPVYTGLLSNVGVFLWCAATGICLFTGALARRWGSGSARFLFASALLSGTFLADDFFMIHEWLAPKLLGVEEHAVQGLYAAALLAYVVGFRAAIRAAGAALLVTALALFGVTTVLDVLEPVPAPGSWYYVEEGFKLFGIASWFLFLAAASARALESTGRTAAGAETGGDPEALA